MTDTKTDQRSQPQTRCIHIKDMHKYKPADMVYCGRRTSKVTRDMVFAGADGEFGNKFAIGEHGTRTQVIAKHRQALSDAERERIKKVCRGRVLVCYCVPQACHTETLKKIADASSVS